MKKTSTTGLNEAMLLGCETLGVQANAPLEENFAVAQLEQNQEAKSKIAGVSKKRNFLYTCC